MQPQGLPLHFIYSKSNAGLTAPMQSVHAVRQENLATLIAERFAGQQAKFAERMDYEPSMVSRLLSKNKKTRQNIGSALARKIEAKVGLEENWLDVPHRELSARQELGHYNVTAGPALYHTVPLISWVQAGKWKDVVDNLQPGQGEQWIHTTARVGPHAYALRIVGDSMTNPAGAPSFPDGTIIIVDPDRAADPGKFVVVRQRDSEECTFKQLVRDAGHLYLKPLNPRYPLLEMAQDAVICGVLVQAVMDFS